MKASKFSEAQIAFVLKQAEEGPPVGEVCRKAGISDATFYNWCKKYAGLMPSEMKHLRQLEEENAKLKCQRRSKSRPHSGRLLLRQSHMVQRHIAVIGSNRPPGQRTVTNVQSDLRRLTGTVPREPCLWSPPQTASSQQHQRPE